MFEPRSTSTSHPHAAISVTASILALVVLFLALLHADALGTLPGASLAGGLILAVSLSGALLALALRRLEAAALMPLLTLGLLASAAASSAVAELASDLNLRTVGRPPQFLWPLVASMAGLVAAQTGLVARGIRPARAGLVLLLPLLTLEGLPLGAPPALGGAVAGILLLLSGRSGIRPRLPLSLPILVFLVCVSASTCFGADPTPGVPVILRLVALSCAFVLIAGDEQPVAAVRLSLWTQLVTLIIVGLLALYARSLLSGPVSALGATSAATELSLFERHPNVIAPWFGAGAVLALMLVGRPTGSLRLVATLALPLSAVCLFLTASRLAVAAALVAALVPSLLRLRKIWTVKRRASESRVGRGLLLRISVVLLVVLASALLVPSFRDKLINRAGHANILSESHRVHRMKVAFETALDRPWLGQGPLCWFRQGAFAPHSRFEGLDTADHPHNLPLALFESTGVIGLAAFLWLALAAFRLLLAVLADEDRSRRNLGLAVAAALLAQLLANLGDAGDSLDTLIPSRLLIDLGLLVALFRAGSPHRARGISVGRVERSSAGLVVALGSMLLLAGGAMATMGTTLARQGKSYRAADTLELAAKLLPFDVPVRLRLVGIGFAIGDFELSQRHLLRAEALAPDRPDLLETRARLAQARGNSSAALESAERAFELDPNGATGLRLAPLVAELRFQNGDQEGGIEALAVAASSNFGILAQYVAEDRPGLFRIGSAEIPVTEILSALRRPLDDESSDRSRRRVLLRECEINLLFGNHEEADAAMEEVERIDGGRNVTYYQFRARILASRGDLAGAVEAVAQGIADVDSPYLRAEEARYLLALGRVDDAIVSLKKGLALSQDAHFTAPAYQDLLRTLEQAYSSAGNSVERRPILDQLCFFVDDDLERVGLLASLAELEAADGNRVAAIQSIDRALLLLLRSGLSESSREEASRLGRLLGGIGPGEVTRSRFADEYERFAARIGGGKLLHLFRLALLRTLGLEARAEQARKDLRADRPRPR